MRRQKREKIRKKELKKNISKNNDRFVYDCVILSSKYTSSMLREQTTQDEEHFLAWCCNRALFDFCSLDADVAAADAARFFLFLFLLNCAVREIRRPKQKNRKKSHQKDTPSRKCSTHQAKNSSKARWSLLKIKKQLEKCSRMDQNELREKTTTKHTIVFAKEKYNTYSSSGSSISSNKARPRIDVNRQCNAVVFLEVKISHSLFFIRQSFPRHLVYFLSFIVCSKTIFTIMNYKLCLQNKRTNCNYTTQIDSRK